MDIFEIIKEKEWNQLSVDEVQLFLEMEIGEDQFIEMKSDLSALTENSTITPSNNVKENLDHAFTEMHGKDSVTVFAYWKWAAAAAIGLLIIGVGVSFLVGPKEALQMAKAEVEQEQGELNNDPDFATDTMEQVQQEKRVKYEVPFAVDDRNAEPKNLGMLIPTADEVKNSEEFVAQIFQEEVRRVDVKDESAFNDSQIQIKESKSAAAAAVLEEDVLRASSFNSSQNSVLAYRKMKEEVSNKSVQGSKNMSIRLVDLNLDFKGLVTLY